MISTNKYVQQKSPNGMSQQQYNKYSTDYYNFYYALPQQARKKLKSPEAYKNLNQVYKQVLK